MTDTSGREPWIWIVFGVAVLEIVLSLTWNRTYFTVGVPIFRRDLVMGQPGPAMPTPERLEKAMSKSVFPAFAFRALENNLLGFRERARSRSLRFHYTPVMHGNLLFEASHARLRVTGLTNWFTVAFLVFVIASSVMFERSLVLVFLVVLYGGIYFIQARRFRGVSRDAAKEWMTSR